MPRDLNLYVEDVISSAEAIKEFIGEMSFEEFKDDRKTYSATIREYIIIGEAVTQLMGILEDEKPEYPWRMVKDFRNMIVHEYFGIDTRIVWDLTVHELDALVDNIRQLTYNRRNLTI